MTTDKVHERERRAAHPPPILSVGKAKQYLEELKGTLAVFEKLKNTENPELAKSIPKSLARTKYIIALVQKDIQRREELPVTSDSQIVDAIPTLKELID